MRIARVLSPAVAVLACLGWPASVALAGDPPKIDGPSKAKQYTLIRLSAKNTDEHTAVVWRVKPADPAAKVDWATPQNVAAVVWVAPPGKYAVEMIAIGPPDKDGRPSLAIDEVTVEIESPVPPPPPPPPPTPDSPLRAKLRAAFNADAGDQAAKDLVRADLVALYRKAAKLAGDKTIPSTLPLIDQIRKAGVTLASDALIGTRKVIAGELAAAYPADTALTDDVRVSMATLLGSIADALAW